MEINKEPIVEQCVGCARTIVGPEPGPANCTAYPMPASKWRNGKTCPMATHLKREAVEDNFKLNPLKASKRSMKR